MASEGQISAALRRGNWGILGRVVLFWVGYLAVVVLAWFAKGMAPPQFGQLVWGLASSVVLLLLTWVFLRWDGRRFRDVGMNVEAMSVARLVVGVGIGLAIFAVILVLVDWIACPVRLARGGASGGSVVVSVCTVLAVASMEEIGFRGYPLRTLIRAVGLWRAQAIVAVAFGLCHVAYGWSWSNILLGVIPFGILFGFAATGSRGLAVPIGVHAGINFAQWAVGDASGIWKLVFDEGMRGRVGMVSRVGGIGVSLLGAFLFWWVSLRRGGDEVES
jgi:membrane protease YdiL (CAAX protease family)